MEKKLPGQLPDATASKANVDKYKDYVAPPPYFPQDTVKPHVTNTIKPFNAGLSNEDAKNALLQHVAKSWSMSKKVANKMEIKSIEYSFIHILALETFSELRRTRSTSTSYRSGHVDDTSCGQIPDVWDVPPSAKPTPFKDGKCTMTVPHSEYISECTCFDRSECSTCSGTGKLLYSQQLKISWKNHLDEHVSEPNFIPKHKLIEVTGDVIYKDQAQRVSPIDYITLPDISEASQRLINKHEQVYLTKERPLIQQQMVQVIQVAAVQYEHNGEPGTFWIFGKEYRVHAPEYPKSCVLM